NTYSGRIDVSRDRLAAVQPADRPVVVGLSISSASRDRSRLVVKVETKLTTCLVAEKEARDSAREARSVTGRYFVTTSRASRSPPFVDWHVVAVSSVSLV